MFRNPFLLRSYALTLAVITGAAAQSGEPVSTDATDAHLEQLENCRAGILDSEATVEGRRRWIDNLLSYDTPSAKALFVELLGDSRNTAAQLAMCNTVARHARRHPERLASSFVAPLIDLLGSNSADLRAAAAEALADFPSDGVVTKLGAIAAQSDASMDKRLAAIDAMVSKVDQREVIGELMALLEAGVPEITQRVVAALEPVSRETFGTDMQRWRAWWNVKKQLSDEAWLTDQLAVFRERVHDLTRELESRLEEEKRRRESVTARLGGMQREVFRGLGADQQEVRLAEWLNAPEPEVQQISLELITARMADGERRPGGDVRAALLGLLESGGVAIRRAILEIIQNLENEPAVVDAVLAQLAREQDSALRLIVFRALGKLDSKEAIPDLIFEIANPHSEKECVREAAIALGHIASGATQWEHVEDAVLALKRRYKLESGNDAQLRAALLVAMAGVGDPVFAPEFLDALDSDESDILRPAIRGLRVTKERSKIPRLRTLTASPDAMVRLAAIQAIGELGGDDADIEAVLTRLKSAIEPDELAREAAWTAYRGFLAGKSATDKLRHAERLRDTPTLEIRYLQELLDETASTGLTEMEAEAVRERLVDVLIVQGLYADASPHLRNLCLARMGRSGRQTEASCEAWLGAVLRVAEPAKLAQVVVQLIESGGEKESVWIISALAPILKSPANETERERNQQVLLHLRSIDSSRLGVEWTNMLDDVKDKLAALEDKKPRATSP